MYLGAKFAVLAKVSLRCRGFDVGKYANSYPAVLRECIPRGLKMHSQSKFAAENVRVFRCKRPVQTQKAPRIWWPNALACKLLSSPPDVHFLKDSRKIVFETIQNLPNFILIGGSGRVRIQSADVGGE
jgi:hypothetical protein